MPISRTAMVLRNQGDPIFGAIARAIRGGVRVVRGVVRAVRGSTRVTQIATQGTQAISRTRGVVTTIAKSRTGRVLAEAAAVGGATAVGVRVGARGRLGPVAVEGEFVSGPGGCPTSKIVQVAAHTREIPLDRFGRPRRRIDVLNTKALSRATRRLGGFQKRARRVEKQLSKIAPRSRSRSRKRC